MVASSVALVLGSDHQGSPEGQREDPQRYAKAGYG